MFITLSIADTVANIIISIGEGIGEFLAWIFSFLPDDPINLNDTIFNIPPLVRQVLGFVNWFIPIADSLILISAWILLILSIWFIRVLLKFAHFI